MGTFYLISPKSVLTEDKMRERKGNAGGLLDCHLNRIKLSKFLDIKFNAFQVYPDNDIAGIFAHFRAVGKFRIFR